MLKPLPHLLTDEEAEHFVETADLTEYDLSTMRRVRFDIRPLEDKRVSLRLPMTMLDAVKARAAAAGVSAQHFLRDAVQAALAKP